MNTTTATKTERPHSSACECRACEEWIAQEDAAQMVGETIATTYGTAGIVEGMASVVDGEAVLYVRALPVGYWLPGMLYNVPASEIAK